MSAKDVFVRDTLRLITSEIKRFEVDNRSEVKDEDVISILKKMSKQRKDSIEQYSKGGRPDLEKIESDELKISMNICLWQFKVRNFRQSLRK